MQLWTPLDPADDEELRAPKSPLEGSIWAHGAAGRRRGPDTPVALAVWAPEVVRGRGDAAINRVAEGQRGFAHRHQLRLAGCTSGAIRHRLNLGWLHGYHRDVYLVGRPRVEPLGFETAAVLHFAGYAVLSHRSAGAMWGLIDAGGEALPSHVTVTCVGREGHAKPGLTVHRAGALHRNDLARRHGLPVTSPARVLVELAGEVDPLELESALAIARARRLASDAKILAAIDRAPNHRGVGVLRELIASPEPLRRTRSDYERRFLRLIREAELPAPRVNAHVGGLEVDFLWPEHGLVVELDGVAFHSGRAAFERDRRRDRRLIGLGHRVIRVTARQLDEAPLAVIAAIAMVLGGGAGRSV